MLGVTWPAVPPEGVLDRVVLNTLFPDTSYANESGGDPEVIPELTYEQFLDFQSTFPIQGTTLLCENLGVSIWHFNPRSLCRERRFDGKPCSKECDISIHVPYAGNDAEKERE